MLEMTADSEEFLAVEKHLAKQKDMVDFNWDDEPFGSELQGFQAPAMEFGLAEEHMVCCEPKPSSQG